ncbi:MAG: fibronectin type III domain-containing protein, partial [Deferribacteres bacterium]|nr:fibronectin type III domain-containing protein [Deferribacteres bacterium]
RVTGLFASTTYYFVVRAKDEAGNVDNNTAEVSATTQTPPDTTPPTFGGATSATAVSSSGIDLTWNAATDNVTASSNIVYLIYLSTTSGGQNFQTPNYTTAAGATSYAVTGLNSSTTYYFVVRAKDEAGNVDNNTVEVSATTLSLFSMH